MVYPYPYGILFSNKKKKTLLLYETISGELISRELCWVININPKRLHNMIPFIPSLKWQNYRNGEQWLWGIKERVRVKGKWVWLQQGNTPMRDLCNDGHVLYLDCIDVNILVVILYYSFARCNHWGNCVKDAPGIFVLFLKTACDSTTFSK